MAITRASYDATERATPHAHIPASASSCRVHGRVPIAGVTDAEDIFVLPDGAHAGDGAGHEHRLIRADRDAAVDCRTGPSRGDCDTLGGVAKPGRMRLGQWPRRASVAEICARIDPDDPECEGALYAVQTTNLTPEQEAEVLRHAARYRLSPEAQRLSAIRHQLLMEGKLWEVTGQPLSSESIAPFVLDGCEYISVWAFYQSLKLLEDDPRRQAVASGRRRRAPRGGRTSFRYRGEEIAVHSVEHGVLVARATEAKVLAHEHVQRALAATGTSRLYMGNSSSQTLARYMPFALMLLR